MLKLSRVIRTIFAILLLVVIVVCVQRVAPIYAITQQQIEQQKSQKQQELNKILKDIQAISSSNASISSKLSDLKKERNKLNTLLGSMSADLTLLEEETKKQETELVGLANTYSLQQALFYVDSQKNLLVTLFEAPSLSNLLDRLLYYNVQTQSMRRQRDLIATKNEAIVAKKLLIAQEQASIQKSLSTVSQQMATLENQQATYAASLTKSYSQRNSLVSDISKLSRAAQAIINKKASSVGNPSGGVGSGSGGGGNVGGATTPSPTGAISIFVGGTLFKKTDGVVRMNSANNAITLKGIWTTEFAGTLEFNKKSGVYAINDLPLDQYLWGLAEMPSFWPLEALKVQAIAGRSYATYKMRYGGYGKYDLVDYVQDQEYSGLSKINALGGSNWKNAVDSTSGKVLEYAGKTPIAYYSADNGGHSVSGTERGFGSGGYLAAKVDRYLSGSVWTSYGSTSCGYWIIQGNKTKFPWCGRTRQSEGVNTMARMQDYLNGAIYYGIYGKMVTTGELSASALKAKLTAKGNKSIQDQVGTISDIKHVYDQGGSTIAENTKYTKYVVVTGSKGSVTLSGTAFKISYNVRAPYNNAVYSTLYDIKKINNDNWELWTRGFGHRVGMSQYGAKGRADAGQGYEAILKYYYNNANVVQYNIGRNVRVALTKVGSRVMKVTAKSEISIYDGGVVIKKVPANTETNTEIRIEYN